MKIIESTTNSWLKAIKKLQQKKYRDQESAYLIEGEHLIEEAINASTEIVSVMTTADGIQKYAALLSKVPSECLFQLSEPCMKQLSELSTPPDLIAVVKKTETPMNQSFQSRILVLDRIQDPGNLGTIIRTADAAGFESVVLGEGCVDLYQSKVQRALQGSQFHISIVTKVPLLEWIQIAHTQGVKTYATALDETALPIKEVKSSDKLAIIMGNEGRGVSQELLESVHQTVYIPMKGQAESLNVAVAAGIVMFAVQE